MRRVDFRRQMAIVNGEIMRDTEVERAPSQPGRKTGEMRDKISSFNVWISLVSCTKPIYRKEIVAFLKYEIRVYFSALLREGLIKYIALYWNTSMCSASVDWQTA